MADNTQDLSESADSLPANDAMADSSTADNQGQQDANAGKSMLDFVKEQVPVNEDEQDEPSEESSPEEEPKEIGDKPEEKEESPKEDEKKEDSEQKEDGSEDEEKVDVDQTQQGPVPYQRFQEVNEKYKKLEQEHGQAKPTIEAHNAIVTYCNQNNITQEQFSKALEVQALLNSNPEEALKRLLPIVEAIQGYTGERLPKDLQEKVDTGKMELDDARKWARDRAQISFGKTSAEHLQRARQQEQQQTLQRSLLTAVDTWAKQRMGADPDFKPKANDNLPDGKFELVYAKFNSLLHATDAQGKLLNSASSPQEMTSLLQRAYDDVQKALAPLVRKPATRKTLSHNGSSRTATSKSFEQAGSMSEAVKLYLAQR